MTKRKFWIVLLAIWGFAGTPHFAGAADEDQLGEVKAAILQILEILRDEQFRAPSMHDERKKRVVAAVNSIFDMMEMSKRTLAGYWDKISPAEQQRFTELFGKLVEFRYSGKIDNYSGQEIQFKKEVIRGDKALLYSCLLDNGTEIPIIYQLLNKKGRWLIFDLKIENVSLVVNYRREFSSILKDQEFTVLLTRIAAKVAELQEPR